MTSGIRTLVLTAGVLGLGLAACTTATDDYYRQIAEIKISMTERMEAAMPSQEVIDACGRGDQEACAKFWGFLREMTADLDKAYGQMSVLAPPEEAKSWHYEYIASTRTMVAALDSMNSAYLAGDRDGFLKAIDALLAESHNHDRLSEEFNRRWAGQ